MDAGKYTNVTYDANDPQFRNVMAEQMGIPVGHWEGQSWVQDNPFPNMTPAQINDAFYNFRSQPLAGSGMYNGLPTGSGPSYFNNTTPDQISQAGAGGGISGPLVFNPTETTFDKMWVPLLMSLGMGGALAAGGALGGAAGGAGGATGASGASTGGSMFDLFDPSTWGDLTNLPPTVTGMPNDLSALSGPGTQDWWSQYGLNASDVGGSSGSGSLLSNLFSGSGSGASSATSLLGKLLGSGGSGLNLGTLLGALAGGINANQKPAGVTTTVQDIPDYLKGYQNMNLTNATNNFGAAGAGNALLPGALGQLGATISGAYLNPATNPAFQPYAQDLMGQAGSQFHASYGATPEAMNNSGNQEGFTRAITNAVLPLYNSAYQTERSNQVNAAGQAPAFASNYAGATLAPNLAYKNLYTGPTATSTPYFTNQGAGILAGGLAGSQLGKLFG